MYQPRIMITRTGIVGEVKDQKAFCYAEYTHIHDFPPFSYLAGSESIQMKLVQRC